MEFKNGNTFATVAFSSYGLFWLSLVGILVLPALGFGEAASPFAMGSYLALWGLFTLFMFFGTLKANRALQFVFASLVLLFFLLAAGEFTGIKAITVLAGFEGLVCGFSAFYLAMVEVINEAQGRQALPIGALPTPPKAKTQ